MTHINQELDGAPPVSQGRRAMVEVDMSTVLQICILDPVLQFIDISRNGRPKKGSRKPAIELTWIKSYHSRDAHIFGFDEVATPKHARAFQLVFFFSGITQNNN
jgi:hypothetical protein